MKYSKELGFWIDVLLHPGKSTKRDIRIKDALKLYYKLAIIPVILGLIVAYAVGGFNPFSPFVSTSNPIVGLGMVLLLMLVITPINIFVSSGIYHLIIGKLFKLYKKDYSKPFAALTYGTLPGLIVYWIYPLKLVGMVIVGIFGVWGLIVEIIALSNQLGMSRLKALGTLVLYTAIVIIAAILVTQAILVGGMMGTVGGMTGLAQT